MERHKIIKENLSVKGEPDREIELHYTHHGPLHILIKRLVLMLLDAWLEPGGSPILFPRMDRQNWQEFIEACS